MVSWVTPRIWTTGERVGQSKMNEISNDLTYLKDFVDAIYLTIYPVGAIYISVTSTNPGTYLGGTWAAFGTGRTLVGIDTGQSEFNVVEETGGAKTHSLTSAENGPHTHSVSTLPTSYDYAQVAGSGYFAAAVVGSVTTGSSGSGTAHNNLQPYIVVYMWKRTA